jgi:Meckel syndrome type 1 protein
MNKMQIFARALLEQIEVARVRQLSGLQESFNTKHEDTTRAISIFQKYTGLDQTGVPDPKTMNTIKMVAEDNPNMGPYGDLATPAKPATAPAAQPPTQQAAPSAPKKPFVPDPAGVALAKQMKMDPAAIKRFQQSQGLNPDGQIGPKTTAALKTAMAKQQVASDMAKDGPRSTGTGEKLSTAVDLNSPAMSALNQPGVAPTQTNSLTQNPNQEAGINAPAAPATKPGVDTGMTDRNPYDDNALAQQRLDAHQAQQTKYSDQGTPAPAADPAAPKVTPASALAAAKAPANSLTAGGNEHNPEAELDPAIAASRKQFPEQPQVPAYMPGNSSSAPAAAKPAAAKPAAAKPAAPAGGQVQSGTPGLTWGTNPGVGDRPDGGVSGESVNRSNQRMVEDPELTAMLRIAGLR